MSPLNYILCICANPDYTKFLHTVYRKHRQEYNVTKLEKHFDKINIGVNAVKMTDVRY